MGLLDRILLAFYATIMVLASILVILLSSKLITIDIFRTSIEALYGRWEAGLVGTVLLVISLKLLFSGFKTKSISETLVESGDLGSVSVSFNAIENLVLKVTQKIEDIKDVKVNVKDLNSGIAIDMKLVVTSDIIIPELTADLQNDIKEYIETSAGVLVKNVEIKVDNILNSHSTNRAKLIK